MIEVCTVSVLQLQFHKRGVVRIVFSGWGIQHSLHVPWGGGGGGGGGAGIWAQSSRG